MDEKDESDSFAIGEGITNNEAKSATAKVKWSSRVEFIISLLGYSLGLSDVWRVPYLTYRNGGGAFLIPYILALCVCGIPLYFLEIMMSQFSGKGTWAVWDFCPLFRGFGLSFLVLNWVVTIYATVLRAWTVEYLIDSFSGVLPWSTCDNEWNTPSCTEFGKDRLYNTTEWYNISHIVENQAFVPIISNASVHLESSEEQFWRYKILKMSTGIDDIGPVNGKYILYIFIIYVIVWISLVKSVQSIGKMMYVTCLAPIIFTIIIWIRALMLPGAKEGMLYFIYPDIERLGHIEVWIEAGFMAFYTLGPAWGGLAIYGSHNKFHENCYRDSIFTVIVELSFALLNGLVMFSVVGVMAAETGVDISEVITSGGFSLGFVAYPKAIAYLPLPQLWSVLLFIILLLPGLDSMTVLLEPVLCVIEEIFPKTIGKRRIPLLTFVLATSLVLVLPFTSKAGVFFYQLIDWYTATFSVMLIALIESLLFSWAYGGDRLSRDTKIMLRRKLPHFVRISCAFVTPVILFVLLMASIFKYKPPTYGTYTYPAYASAIGWCFSMLSIIPFVLWALYAVWREHGSFIQRIRGLLSPLSSWGPCQPQFREVYEKSEICNKRSLKSLALFNLLGQGEMKMDEHIEQEIQQLC